MKIYWQLFTIFLKVGAFSIGGGFAMIPLIEREIVVKKKWIEPKEFLDMLALTQSVPGLFAINTAIFVGYKIKGVRGSLVASLGTTLPSFIIIMLVAMYFFEMRENETVARVFKGIRPAVVAIISVVVLRMAKTAKITWKTAFIPIGAALLIWGLSVSPVWVILAVTIGSIIYGIFAKNQINNSTDKQINK